MGSSIGFPFFDFAHFRKIFRPFWPGFLRPF